jgi:polyhydroxybutyrate depolymerase
LFGLLQVTVPFVGAQEGAPPPLELDRSYQAYLPSNYTEDQEWPLLLVLHGAGGTGNGIMEFTGFNAIAEREGFIALYPDGLANDWDFGFGRSTEAGIITIDDIGFLTDLVDMISQDYNVDLERVFVTGFSNGAQMAYLLACKTPERFNGIAGVAAPLSVALTQPCSEVPISTLFINGTADPILSWEALYDGNQRITYSSVETTLFWAQHNGCDTAHPHLSEILNLDTTDESTILSVSYGGCLDGTRVKIYGIEGGGHTWPGHPLEAAFELGPTNMDIDASEIIWSFFESLPDRVLESES